MKRSRDQFLSGSRLSDDENRGRGRTGLFHLPIELSHALRRPYNGTEALFNLELRHGASPE